MRTSTKTYYPLLFIFFQSFCFGQIATQPETFSKIKFTYSKVPNYSFDTKGFYGDTTQLKQDFPRASYTFDSSKKTGFIAFDAMSQDEKSKLMRILYQNTEMVTGEYDVNKNKTTFLHVRENTNLNLLFKSVFNTDYPYLDYTVVYDFDKNLEIIKFPKQKTIKNSIENKKMLTWLYSDVNKATFLDGTSKNYSKNTVIISMDLNQFVNPLPLFDNCVFGVKELETPEYTMILQTVSFE